MSERLQLICGHVVTELAKMPDESVQCIVTSPPYWGLRDYKTEAQVWGTNGDAWRGSLGLEPTIELYVRHLTEIFRQCRRVLRKDGTLWLNLGDSYASGKGTCYNPGGGLTSLGKDRKESGSHPLDRGNKSSLSAMGLKPKDLCGIPWRVAFALQADGWWLRSDIIWAKPNPMPESVRDRPTRAHEYIFLMTKSAKYYYEADAIEEKCSLSQHGRTRDDQFGGNKGAKVYHSAGGRYKTDKQRGHSRRHAGFNERWDGMTKIEQCACTRNKRSVWTVATQPYREAHFATFPEKLITPCILAGSAAGDMILDPFGGSGTVGKVALELGRRAVLIELNAEYVKMAQRRCAVTPGMAL